MIKAPRSHHTEINTVITFRCILLGVCVCAKCKVDSIVNAYFLRTLDKLLSLRIVLGLQISFKHSTENFCLLSPSLALAFFHLICHENFSMTIYSTSFKEMGLYSIIRIQRNLTNPISLNIWDISNFLLLQVLLTKSSQGQDCLVI